MDFPEKKWCQGLRCCCVHLHKLKCFSFLYKREVQITLHHIKTPMVVLVTFPRQEQSIPEVCQEQEESCQWTLESKCQMTQETKTTDSFFLFYFKTGKDTAQKGK